MLLLRGFATCVKCLRMLCGNNSKSRNGYCHYYHCLSSCGCRYKAEQVNAMYIDQLVQCEIVSAANRIIKKEIIVNHQ